MNNWYIIALIIVTLVSVIITIVNNIRTSRTFDSIEKMLDATMEDSFTEETFDESRLSALETKFAHFLSASSVSARNVRDEKDKIKTLISDISHQTKTPISNLLLYSELLNEEELPESAKNYVESIHGQTEKLRFLIDSLVKMSRLENGILVLSPKQEELQPMLRKVYNEYRIKAEDKGIDFILKDIDGRATFDSKWTAEAVGNIVDNAIKYTDAGSVEISAAEYDMFVRIDIADTGIGISEEEQAKVFSRFYRSEDVREQQGVGIGLYLARQIVSSEGGYIKLESKVGEGTKFSVFLQR